MIKGYRGSDGDTSPVPFECEAFGYPHLTMDGEAMYENTHFRTEAEAWDSIRLSAVAGVKLSGDKVMTCREQLRAAERRAADAAVRFTLAMDGLAEWVKKQGL